MLAAHGTWHGVLHDGFIGLLACLLAGRYLVLGRDEGTFAVMRNKAVQKGAMEVVVAGLLWAVAVLLFIYMFANFMMGFLAYPYFMMRRAMR